MNAWIGVDLDGTLARYDGWVAEDHVGEPIELMAERVRNWLANGLEVRIVTARVSAANARERSVEEIRSLIQDWTERHFGVRLAVTNEKDYGMVELWDDRAVQVEPNTGRVLGREPDGLSS